MDKFFKWQIYYKIDIDGGKIEQEKRNRSILEKFFIIFLSQGFK